MMGARIGICVVMGLLLCFSQECMAAALSAARVFAGGVMPALFPMMVLSGLPVFADMRGDTLHIAFAFAAGSPAGSRKLSLRPDAQSLNAARRRRLLVTAGVMSPMFFLGTLSLWTGSHGAAFVMLAAHWFSALLVGALAGFCMRCGNKKSSTPEREAAWAPRPVTSGGSFAQGLAQSITAASQAVLSVCGAMMLFAVAAALLRALANNLFPVWAAANGRALAVLHALLEIGGGAEAVVRAFADGAQPPFALLCALCSFGGISIWMQNLPYTAQNGHPGALLGWSVAQGVAAYAICSVLLGLFPGVVSTGAFMPSGLPLSVQQPLPPLFALLGLAVISWQKSKTCLPHS